MFPTQDAAWNLRPSLLFVDYVEVLVTHSATGVRRGVVIATALLSGGKVSSIELGDFLGAANIPIFENGSIVMGVGRRYRY